MGLTDERVIIDCLRPGIYATKTELATYEGRFSDSREWERITPLGTSTWTPISPSEATSTSTPRNSADGRTAHDAGEAITIDLGRVRPDLARTLLAGAEANRSPDELAGENDPDPE